MIKSDVKNDKLKDLFKLYKQDYAPIENKFIHNFVYIEDKKNIGFIIYSSIYENAEVIDLFVIDEYRKKGIGTKLLEKMLSKNKDKNITLEVNKNNKPAIKLYENNGFEKVAVRKGYYNGVDGYLMLKK